MWPYHITGTPGCSTPLCSVPLTLHPDLGDALLPLRERHPGQRGLMACQPFPRQHTWLQRASRQLQGQGGTETKDALVLCGVHQV